MLVIANKNNTNKYIMGKGLCSCEKKSYHHGRGIKEIVDIAINLAKIGKSAHSINKDLKKDDGPDPNLVNLIREINGRGFNLT